MKKKLPIIIIAASAVLLLIIAGIYIYSVRHADYLFARSVSDDEREKRIALVEEAVSWYGTEGGSTAHAQLLEIYNSQEVLPVGYAMKQDDAWCAAFVTVVAIRQERTDIIPAECGCQRQIELFQKLGCWEETDDYEPLPGDIIYYAGSTAGENTGRAKHVGIVVGCWRGWIKVIEGNYADRVEYRYIRIGDASIRGYGIPDYEKLPVE